jgi:hypothetical protein
VINFPRDEDFPDIVRVIGPLAQKGILGNISQLRHVAQELNVTGLYSGFSQVPREVIRKYAQEIPCGECSWV